MTVEQPCAALIAALLTVDPEGLGGVWLRARHGPRRDDIVAFLQSIPGRHSRIMPETGDFELFGGVDLSESLISGRLAEREGLLSTSDVLWLTRAERTPVRLAARLAHAVDKKTTGAIILCDESAEPDEAPPAALRDRLAFFMSDDLVHDELSDFPIEDAFRARRLRDSVRVDENLITIAARTAADVGCKGSRPALFLVRCVRALAALEGAAEATEKHLRQAARLVLPHRMQAAPDDIPEKKQPEVADSQLADRPEANEQNEELLRDIVVDAASVTLPEGLLAGMIARDRRGAGSGHGAERVSKVRGRPLPSRPGKPDGRSRLDVLATLQAAAPWQKLRGSNDGRLSIRSSDLRVRRYREQSERLLLFVVDASGSAAMARLAEAKGAAETILSEAYRSRDHVGLITFRGDSADCALEPTRSLVRAKRLLSGLPSGGATPLAAALRLCTEHASTARRKGLTPHVILMTDGRANKALDGTTDRIAAQEDALKMARGLAASGVHALVVDSGLRPSSDLEDIAQLLGAGTIRLPRGLRNEASAELLSALDR